MSIVLTVLGGVSWRGQPVVGERPQALLAALAAAGGRVVPGERLIEAVWGDEPPANATKALQVLVSRTRAQCGQDAVIRDGDGYRLGVAADQVDALRLAALTHRARTRLAAGDLPAARAAVAEATALAEPLLAPPADDDRALADLRRAAAAHRAELTGLRGRLASMAGEHEAALPLLTQAFAADPRDEALLACLLRSESVVRGTGAALERYERYRAGLRDRLGTAPGDAAERAYRELLHRDRPVRDGLQFDPSPLVGRDEDLRRLRALVRASRVVSIVGAGGLGKTRLAHVLGRSAEQPVVHFVGLAGVGSPEDLIGELGSALGVRDSVNGRRALAREQRADLRARIAQQLGAVPTLLILDNCEHLVDAVADLVAFLVATTADLRVVTTSRAPLAINAEQVYPLEPLADAAAVDLFRQRAVAARPGVALPDDVVADIVARLDGLPLAIELAAVKVRVMSVEEIRRRLADRFALLRGGLRTSPSRHRTLLDVIDWSWNLLAERERRALRWLSVFQDGLTLAAAEEVLGWSPPPQPDVLAAVQALVDQSLLTVTETPAGVRYRMLETVREFGQLRLAEAGERDAAYAARRAWAVRHARTAAGQMFGDDQFAAIDALDAEETNLADELRRVLAGGTDREALLALLCGLGGLWSIRGEHARVAALAGAVAEQLDGWSPPPELADSARAALLLVLHNAIIGAGSFADRVGELLRRLGVDEHGDRRTNAMVRVLLAQDPGRGPAGLMDRLDGLASSPDPFVAVAALQWLGHLRENSGDLPGAIAATERALALMPEAPNQPWPAAIMRASLATLHLQQGHHEAAVTHALAAMPPLERLGARDDLIQLYSLMALCAVRAGRLDEAEDWLARTDRLEAPDGVIGSLIATGIVAAEVALAKGDRAGGLAAYRRSAARLRSLVLPGHMATGAEPWFLVGDATLLTALAYYGDGEQDEAEGAELFLTCLDRASRVLGGDTAALDYPVCGMVLLTFGVWGLLRSALPAPDAVRLLVLADRFAYNRMVPTLAWERIEPVAEERAPGHIARLRAEYGDRRPAELADEARRVVDQARRQVSGPLIPASRVP
ncbi:MAG: AAA family ATPase [Frankia sp.]|nr:AAA family ATPase [Frankia sp.]